MKTAQIRQIMVRDADEVGWVQLEALPQPGDSPCDQDVAGTCGMVVSPTRAGQLMAALARGPGDEGLRPEMGDVLLAAMAHAGYRLGAVRISGGKQGLFFASLRFDAEGGGEPVEIDARATDALLLAILTRCRIQVGDECWESKGA